jgi:pimeloyl-ACP methyl ester carboxylesterase
LPTTQLQLQHSSPASMAVAPLQWVHPLGESPRSTPWAVPTRPVSRAWCSSTSCRRWIRPAFRISRTSCARAAEGFVSIEEAAEAVAQYLPHRPRPPSNEGLRKNLREHPDGRWRWHWDPRFLDGPRATGVERSEVERELLDAARSLSIATLLVRGASSELVTQAAVDQFLALVPGAEFREVAGARHMVAGDRNDVFADAILDFLARLPPTTGVERAELLT